MSQKGFKHLLKEERLPVDAPESIVDDEGNAVFGTFKEEIPNLNFEDIHNQSCLPDFMNKSRLTLWEASEFNFDDIVILTAVANMGNLFGTTLTIIYDKKLKKRYTFRDTIPAWKVDVAENLLDNRVFQGRSKKNFVKFVNDFGNGKAEVMGHGKDKHNEIEYNVKLTRVSDPSVVNIPFGDNKPLYTQKDLFKLDGYVVFNGKTYKSNKRSTAIIDDHRGYYPFNSHYDWVTTMTLMEVDGKEQYVGFNLTRNQSLDQDKYNENLLWLAPGHSQRLTPVEFDHLEYNKWHIHDEHGMVDLIFDIGDRNIIKLNLLVSKTDYHITFGVINGYVCGEDGKKYEFKNTVGIGEDKTLRF